jgi:RNA polymerase sigma factor (sigma-70 family)
MGNYRIVIADDHPLIRQGLRKVIEGKPGLEVVGEAGDGLSLLGLFETARPDMIILDISMPHLRGIEAISLVKNYKPNVKILVFSMHKEYFRQALAAGAEGYLVKEDADKELFSAIESIREGKSYLSPRLAEVENGGTSPASEALTARERQILKLVAGGKSNKEIGELLGISVRTVESHRAFIIKKLNLKKTADLVRYAMEKGYV